MKSLTRPAVQQLSLSPPRPAELYASTSNKNLLCVSEVEAQRKGLAAFTCLLLCKWFRAALNAKSPFAGDSRA